METYLPLFKTILADWVQLTINEPMYAGALAFIAWLLTASLYSIKITFLKRQSTSRENARIDAVDQLNAAQLHSQELQKQLIENAEQIKKDQEWAKNETERAEKLENQLKERNQQIAAIIQSFSTSFDLGERPVPVTEDPKAESLWQQFDRTIHLFITRLRNEQQAKAELQEAFQAESLKSTENEAVISKLQAGIAAQTIKIANLELLLEEQKKTLQQQHDHAQLVLEQSLANKPAEIVQNTTQTNIPLVNSQAPVNESLTTTPSDTIAPAEPITEPISTPIKTAATESTVSAEITELPPIKSSNDQLGKLKNLFGKTLKKTAIPTPEIIKDQQTDSIIQQPQLEIEPEPVTIKPSKSPLKKMKYYFGEPKQSTETKLDITEVASVPLVTEPEPSSSTKSSFGKLKSLISKLP
jgi:hypothetical protein